MIILTLILLIVTPQLNKEEVYTPIIEKKKVDFRIAFNKLMKYEGGWVNDPDDFGQETFRGITKRYNKSWYGWRHVDAVPNKKWNDSIPAAEFWVLDYYLTVWLDEGFDKLENQEVANMLLDIRVHLHTTQTTRLLNKTYGYNLKYKEDWIIPELDTINLDKLRQSRKEFYLALIKKKPHYKKFKQNWLRRAEYV